MSKGISGVMFALFSGLILAGCKVEGMPTATKKELVSIQVTPASSSLAIGAGRFSCRRKAQITDGGAASLRGKALLNYPLSAVFDDETTREQGDRTHIF